MRESFELAHERHQTLNAFFVADLTLFIGGSALSAFAIAQRRTWAPAVVTFTAGGITYATLYLAQWVTLGGSGSVGLIPMVVATVVTCFIAVKTCKATT